MDWSKSCCHSEKIKNLDDIERIYKEILEAGHCVTLKDLAITGKDLIEAGMKPGKEIGEMLKQLLEIVIEEPELNKRDELLKYVEQSIGDRVKPQ